MYEFLKNAYLNFLLGQIKPKRR